jgi:hypothetical protein
MTGQTQPPADTAREKVDSQLPELIANISFSFIGWHKGFRVAVGAMVDALRAPLSLNGTPTEEQQRAAAAIIHGALIALNDVANMPGTFRHEVQLKKEES